MPPGAARSHEAGPRAAPSRCAAPNPGIRGGQRSAVDLTNRASPRDVALETTLLAHGVPRAAAPALARDLAGAVDEGSGGAARAAVVGLVAGTPTVGMTDDELTRWLDQRPAPLKVNTPNLSVAMHRRLDAATTVSTTLELAAAAGLRLFASGGLGGVHRDPAHRLDISCDLAALARFPVALVASGVKSLLDVEATREALESLGVPVVGYRCDRFPAFYLRESDAALDARFDDPRDLASFLALHTSRAARGVLIANPVPEPHAIDPPTWRRWLDEASGRARTRGVSGRDTTPAVLAELHEVSGGATLRANRALAVANARLAGELAAAMPAAR